MNELIAILGGARSGKSTWAESLALDMNAAFKGKKEIAYLATGEMLDEEFQERIRHHQKKRRAEFRTYEESLHIDALLSRIVNEHHVFVLDCLTTWLGNIFHKVKEEERESFLFATLGNALHVFKNTETGWSTHDLTKSHSSELFMKRKGTGTLSGMKRKKSAPDKILIVVSNELGLGLVPDDAVSRKYRDLHGFMNQRTAAAADAVFFAVSGIPVRIK
jgi:adenosylcobinamide kinase/adenosylcobinamide-phosphate guanylyltransferase